VLPLAHAGHYAVWVLYVLPVLIVVGAIVRSAIAVRREDRENGEPG
jgi:cytochrome c-type biogenesis protein CcmH/NrfF